MYIYLVSDDGIQTNNLMTQISSNNHYTRAPLPR